MNKRLLAVFFLIFFGNLHAGRNSNKEFSDEQKKELCQCQDQREQLEKLETEFEEKLYELSKKNGSKRKIALIAALHPRCGAQSAARNLNTFLLKYILMLAHNDGEKALRDAFEILYWQHVINVSNDKYS